MAGASALVPSRSRVVRYLMAFLHFSSELLVSPCNSEQTPDITRISSPLPVSPLIASYLYRFKSHGKLCVSNTSIRISWHLLVSHPISSYFFVFPHYSSYLCASPRTQNALLVSPRISSYFSCLQRVLGSSKAWRLCTGPRFVQA